MNLDKVIYFMGSAGYCAVFYSGILSIYQDTFTYARFFFLIAMLIHLQSFDLVPSNLTYPPLYPLYKVTAAIILSNIVLLTIFVHLEDIIASIVSLANTTIEEYSPDIVKQNVPPQLSLALTPFIMTVTSLYSLWWVLYSASPEPYDSELPDCVSLCSLYSNNSIIMPKMKSVRRK